MKPKLKIISGIQTDTLTKEKEAATKLRVFEFYFQIIFL